MTLIASCVVVVDHTDPPLRLEPGDSVTKQQLADSGQTKDDIDSLVDRGILVSPERWTEIQQEADALAAQAERRSTVETLRAQLAELDADDE